MVVKLTLIGMVLGIIVWPLTQASGWLFGALAGYVLGELIVVRRRLAVIERRFAGENVPLPAGASREAQPVKQEVAVRQSIASAPARAAEDFIVQQPLAVPAELKESWPGIAPSAATKERVSPLLWQQFPEWLVGGNLLVKVGVVILFFGVAFLLKFASEYGLVPIELRFAAVAIGGLALLVTGWRLRSRRLNYALALQGGGVGVLYLTIFAGLRLYHLLPAGMAFGLLVVLCTLSAYLAVVQDSRALAVLGASGGFLAPVLASTGSGSHVALFSYYALLNGGILCIAWYRSWRLLNLIGFVFTFVIGAVWGAQYYRPAHFATVEPFLLLFVGMFVAAAILFAHRQPPELRGYVDGTLVFGTPLVAFALQSQLVAVYPYGLAWSAVGFGLLYLACAWLVFASLGRPGRLLAEAFLAFSVIFATLAIPLALDGRWTAATWALEGAAMVWIGVRQQRLPARALGILLLFGAGFYFLRDFHQPTTAMPLLNGLFLGGIIISGAALFASRYLQRHRGIVQSWERTAAIGLFAWGLLWWFGAGAMEVQRHVAPGFLQGAQLLFIAASSTLGSFLAGRLPWPLLRWPALGLLPLLTGVFLVGYTYLPHPFAQGGMFGWPVALLLLYRILFKQDQMPTEVLPPAHAAALWLATAVLTVEGAWQLDRLVDGASVWPLVVWGLLPAMLVLLLCTVGQRLAWPVQQYRETYLTLVLGPIALFGWLWAGYANLVSNGAPLPLRYVPLLNPLDVTIGLVLVALWSWQAQLFADQRMRPIAQRQFLAALAITLFFWSNGVLVRTVHHWGGVPFNAAAMSSSILLQASFSIAWSLLALCIMTIATRRGLRQLWMAGGALLGLVVGKLFLVDLSGTGSIERIVSFVGVGLLILLIGWFAPAPPAVKRSPT